MTKEDKTHQFTKETGISYPATEQKASVFKDLVDSVRKLEVHLLPHPNRIICLPIPLAAEKLASGIYLPTEYQAGSRVNEKKTMTRYIIIAFGDNIKEMQFGGKKIEIGDEMIYCDIPDAIRVEIPRVIDYSMLDKYKKIQSYVSFDAAEIHSIIKH